VYDSNGKEGRGRRELPPKVKHRPTGPRGGRTVGERKFRPALVTLCIYSRRTRENREKGKGNKDSFVKEERFLRVFESHLVESLGGNGGGGADPLH